MSDVLCPDKVNKANFWHQAVCNNPGVTHGQRHHRAQALAILFQRCIVAGMRCQLKYLDDMQHMSKQDNKSTDKFGLSHSEHHYLHAGTAKPMASAAVACTKAQVVHT